MAADTAGEIYLLHFSKPNSRGHQHYLGWSPNVTKRFRHHLAGKGAKETKLAVAEGASLTMVQTWPGTPSLEKRLKVWHRKRRTGYTGLCPRCGRPPFWRPISPPSSEPER
jgi:predicted GIY-YIG superfamily endonuclease